MCQKKIVTEHNIDKNKNYFQHLFSTTGYIKNIKEGRPEIKSRKGREDS